MNTIFLSLLICHINSPQSCIVMPDVEVGNKSAYTSIADCADAAKFATALTLPELIASNNPWRATAYACHEGGPELNPKANDWITLVYSNA